MKRPDHRAILGGLSAVGAAALAVAWLAAPSRQSEGRGDGPAKARLPANTVVQAFPASGFDAKDLPKPDQPFDEANYPNRDTVWVVEWDITNAQGGLSSVLRIRAAHFGYLDKARGRQWITVVRDLQLGEIFVPYDDGSHRFEDLESFAFRIRPGDRALLGPPCLSPGEILASDRPGMDGLVYKEVHDDGVRLIDNRGPSDRGRRGEKLLLWVNFDGANYRYLMEFGFGDDGVIASRVGATAQNFYDREGSAGPSHAGGDAHLHVGCWMFDPDLGDPAGKMPGGADKNVVKLVRRVQQNPGTSDGLFRTEVTPFPRDPGQTGAAVAGSALWNADQFTVLRLESTVRKNGSGSPRPTAYDLMTVRAGSCRAFPSPRYDYANRDFWVTPADPSFNQFRQLPTYVARRPEPVDGTPIRVWHNSPLLHIPRGEDLGTDGVSRSEGSALAAWAGFVLRPRDLFDGTPFLAK